ncbi:lipopolysaccharide biosynthesis protein [Marinobacter sp. SS5-14b]|uniref:lipopolysaccharide biosynthesis protein n=1 Tax=Marinobacter sp. SS5-14b TaxID=3050456 RepID=UPI0026DEE8B4|nr:oligosaccharide flippase family protein [Marinobacter sp. SS5-14b]
MSLKKNIIANYASQLYVTGVGILILPLYIKYMGAEAYGLVGFFTMLQAWFGLLDMGLTPTIGRETARYHGGSMSALAYRQLLRALTLIFAGVAVIGGGGLWLFSEVIANQWLNTETLDVTEVILAVQIMAVSVALRWMGGLYRGVVTGSERLVWLSVFNVAIATLRFIAVFGTMSLYGFTPVVFFLHQLAVAIFEIMGLWLFSLKLTPNQNTLPAPVGWSFKPVRPVLKFALSIAFTSSVWVLVTQTDKLVLSGILPLAEYGYFTLAVLVASGIMVISGPVSVALMPRMARLNAEGKREEMIQIYRNATQLVTIIAGSAAIVIAFNAELLLFAWTGDRELAAQAAPILRLYAIGNGFLAVGAFPYYLQYALGNLRYHLIGNAVMVALLMPGIIAAATFYGGVGAGWVWLGVNGGYLLFWVGFVHGRLVPGLHIGWLSGDVCKILFIPMLLNILFAFLNEDLTYDRIAAGGVILANSAFVILLASFGSSKVREQLRFKAKTKRV